MSRSKFTTKAVSLLKLHFFTGFPRNPRRKILEEIFVAYFSNLLEIGCPDDLRKNRYISKNKNKRLILSTNEFFMKCTLKVYRADTKLYKSLDKNAILGIRTETTFSYLAKNNN